jgi:hypothetical protein
MLDSLVIPSISTNSNSDGKPSLILTLQLLDIARTSPPPIQWFVPQGRSRDLKKIDYSNPAACPACPLRSHRPSSGLASGERGGARPDGRPPEGEAGNPRPASRARRASLGQHQAMDEPGRLSDEGPRQAEFSVTALVYNLPPSTSLASRP